MTWTTTAPARILIVDDDLDGREALRRVLTRAHHTVIEAADLASAPALLAGTELVIVDVNLPDGNGLEFTRALRGDARYAGLAILQTSALAVAPQHQAAGLDSGADAYLVHPIAAPVLLSTVSALLRLRRAERELVERERDLRTTMRIGGVTVALVDFTQQRVFASDEHWDLLGLEHADSHPLDVVTPLVHPDDLSALSSALTRIGDDNELEIEYRVQPSNRSSRSLLMRASPVRDDAGELIGIRAAMIDITERRALQDQLATIDQLARGAAAALDLERLFAATLPAVCAAWRASGAALWMIDDDHVDVSVNNGDNYSERLALPLEPGAVAQVLKINQPIVARKASLSSAELRLFGSDAHTVLAAPVRSGDQRIIGVVTVSARGALDYTNGDMNLLGLLGERLGEPIQRAQALADERALVESLQKQLLPQRITRPPGLDVATRYRAGANHLDIGGDWYDCIQLPDRRVLLTVGDVAGKGAAAAVTMGQIRAYTLALATRCDGPAELLAAVNRLVYRGVVDDLATVACLYIDETRCAATLAMAGHVPPMVLTTGPASVRTARYLDAPSGLPVGAADEVSYAERRIELGAEWTVILYTDGLVERRGERLDDSLAKLASRASAHARGDVESLADALLQTGDGQHVQHDDIALLIARFAGDQRLRLQLAAHPGTLSELRRELRAWAERLELDARSTGEVVLATCEAAANAIQHAYSFGRGFYQIEGDRENESLIVTVRDEGLWLDRPSDGKGLDIIATVADEHHIRSTAHGTEVRISFNVASMTVQQKQSGP